MSPRLRIWGACRALAVRSRPVAPRTEPFLNTISRHRLYSDDVNNQPPRPIESSTSALKSQANDNVKVNTGTEGEEPSVEGSAEKGISEVRLG